MDEFCQCCNHIDVSALLWSIDLNEVKKLKGFLRLMPRDTPDGVSICSVHWQVCFENRHDDNGSDTTVIPVTTVTANTSQFQTIVWRWLHIIVKERKKTGISWKSKQHTRLRWWEVSSDLDANTLCVYLKTLLGREVTRRQLENDLAPVVSQLSVMMLLKCTFGNFGLRKCTLLRAARLLSYTATNHEWKCWNLHTPEIQMPSVRLNVMVEHLICDEGTNRAAYRDLQSLIMMSRGCYCACQDFVLFVVCSSAQTYPHVRQR